MNIIPRLMTRKNLQILWAIAEEEGSLRELGERIKCSPGKVHQAILIFKRYGLISVRKEKNRTIIAMNRKSPLYQKIKALVNISRILESRAYLFLKKKAVVGVYGSYAQGTDEKGSDVDLLVFSEKKEIKLRVAIRMLEGEIGKRVNPFILSRERLAKLEKQDKEFAVRLRLTTVMLNGEIFG